MFCGKFRNRVWEARTMSRQNQVPTYRKHKASGQAIVTLTDGFGGRRDVLLGKFATKKSREEYARVIAGWEASGRAIGTAAAEITVAGLIERYWQHIEKHYRRPDGARTSEIYCFRGALRPLNYLFGDSIAKHFGPVKLKAVRQLMVTGYDHPKFGPQRALSRKTINKNIGRLKRLFRWGAENELVSGEVYSALLALDGLRAGRSEARETAPVGPVARCVVEDTLPLLGPMLRDMVVLQMETGMRSGELVILRPCDVDMTGTVWLYRPRCHKTMHHGHQRVIPIGPRGQEVLRGWLTADTQSFLFSPKRNREEQLEERRENRKSPMWPSHVRHQLRKRAKNPRRKPGDHYHPTSYARAIARAIEKHNQTNGNPIPKWHPHQLRHLRATELRREFGLDVARAVLGHRSPQVTEFYAELDLARAAEAMAKMG
jgi:integrase